MRHAGINGSSERPLFYPKRTFFQRTWPPLYIHNASAHITAADSCELTMAGRAQADVCFSYLLFLRPINGASLAVQLNYSDSGFNYHFYTHRPGTGSLYDSLKLLPAAEIYCTLK